MTILGRNRLHYIERVLLYTPIMVGIFIALSVWSGGPTVGFTVIGVILIGMLNGSERLTIKDSHVSTSRHDVLTVAKVKPNTRSRK